MKGLLSFDVVQPALQVIKRQAGVCPSIAPTATAFEAAKKMAQGYRNNLNALIVSGADGKPESIVTEKDFLLKLPLERGASHKISVSELARPLSSLTTGGVELTMSEVNPVPPSSRCPTRTSFSRAAGVR
jgi:hypothetical protein